MRIPIVIFICLITLPKISSVILKMISGQSASKPFLFVIDKFALRQFNNPTYTGTQVVYDAKDFESKVNDYYESGHVKLVDGYAPFCKHLFVPNFADVRCGYTPITNENKHLIESIYESRKENELPVLIQYIDKNKVEAPIATFLDIILYSREQITAENIAMGEVPPSDTSPWGIISVKGQLTDFELPMQPITMMRNALGKEFGGSGVPMEIDKYLESVKFWSENVSLK